MPAARSEVSDPQRAVHRAGPGWQSAKFLDHRHPETRLVLPGEGPCLGFGIDRDITTFSVSAHALIGHCLGNSHVTCQKIPSLSASCSATRDELRDVPKRLLGKIRQVETLMLRSAQYWAMSPAVQSGSMPFR